MSCYIAVIHSLKRRIRNIHYPK